MSAIALFALAVGGIAIGTYGEPPRPILILIGYVAAAACNVAVFWFIIHSAVVSAIRATRDS